MADREWGGEAVASTGKSNAHSSELQSEILLLTTMTYTDTGYL